MIYKDIRNKIESIQFTTNFDFSKLKPILLGYGSLLDFKVLKDIDGYKSEIIVKYVLKIENITIEDELVFECYVDFVDDVAKAIYNYNLKEQK